MPKSIRFLVRNMGRLNASPKFHFISWKKTQQNCIYLMELSTKYGESLVACPVLTTESEKMTDKESLKQSMLKSAVSLLHGIGVNTRKVNPIVCENDIKIDGKSVCWIDLPFGQDLRNSRASKIDFHEKFSSSSSNLPKFVGSPPIVCSTKTQRTTAKSNPPLRIPRLRSTQPKNSCLHISCSIIQPSKHHTSLSEILQRAVQPCELVEPLLWALCQKMNCETYSCDTQMDSSNPNVYWKLFHCFLWCVCSCFAALPLLYLLRF